MMKLEILTDHSWLHFTNCFYIEHTVVSFMCHVIDAINPGDKQDEQHNKTASGFMQ